MMPKNAEEALTISQTLPEPYFKSLKPKTLTDAINSISPGLSVYRKHAGETKSRALVVLILADLVKFFNVGKAMNDVQMAQTADLIFDEFYYLNIEDFKLCFNMAKSGKFGKVYDRMDGQVIMDWLSTYENMRIETSISDGDAKHRNIKAQEIAAKSILDINAERLSK